MYRILITEDIGPAGLALIDEAGDAKYDIIHLPPRDKLIEIIANYDAIITRSGTAMDAGIFAAATNLKIAARAGVGLDNIDVEAATMHGIQVMNTPGANTLGATELTMTLMLGLCRHLPKANASVKNREWTRKAFMGTELSGKTLGVVGLGRIGSRVATRCQAFGMTVIAYDPYIAEEIAERIHVELVGELDELLSRADIITVHTPLTDETRGMIAAGEIAKMKDGARIINAARGGIIEEQALYDALAAGKLAGAALDVYSSEPPKTGLLEKLIGLPNVVNTPHIGASTHESQQGVAVQVAQQVLDALRGNNYQNVVNMPFAEGVDYKSLAPYMTLAEKIGALQMQLIHGRVGRVEVEYRGEELEPHTKLFTVGLLKGMLAPILSETVNYVNAPRMAVERGIVVSQARHPATEDYSNVILCRVTSNKETRLVGGALFLRTEPRIVLIDNIRLDAVADGWSLVMTSHDEPGVMGRVGTLLGEHNVNIAHWHMGREEQGSKQISIINIDSPADEELLETIAALPSVIHLEQVSL